MLTEREVLSTINMLRSEHLDVRTVTLGINLFDCASHDFDVFELKVRSKILKYAKRLVETCNGVGDRYGIPVVNKRIAVSAIGTVCAGFSTDQMVRVCRILDECAKEVGVDFVGGFGALVEKGMTASLLSHTYDCRLEPLEPVQGLMPGMVGKVYMDILYDRGTVIPASTVQMDGRGKYVWVVNPERKVEKRYVEVEGFSGKGVIVSKGFEPGDLLIVEGSRKVSTGMQVEVRMARTEEIQSSVVSFSAGQSGANRSDAGQSATGRTEDSRFLSKSGKE